MSKQVSKLLPGITVVSTAVGGWAFPTSTARKAHYFRAPETDSLCRRYHHMARVAGDLQPDEGKASPDDCVACRRKLEAKGSE